MKAGVAKERLEETTNSPIDVASVLVNKNCKRNSPKALQSVSIYLLVCVW